MLMKMLAMPIAMFADMSEFLLNTISVSGLQRKKPPEKKPVPQNVFATYVKKQRLWSLKR